MVLACFGPLKDHVTFSWRTLEWFEEDEQVQGDGALLVRLNRLGGDP